MLEGGGRAVIKFVRSESDKFGFSHCSGKTEYFKVCRICCLSNVISCTMLRHLAFQRAAQM